MTPWGFTPISSTSTTVSGCMFTIITVDMAAPLIVDSDNGQSISSLIAERERDSRKAAALARARKKIASLLDNVSNSIASLRLSKGLSQQQLADLMGVKQPYIARVERGEDVKMSTITNLATALGEPAEVVFKAMQNVLLSKEKAK